MTSEEPAKHRSPGLIVALVLAGIVGAVAGVAAVIGVGYLFFLLFQIIVVAIGHAIVDAFKQAFSGHS